MWRPVFNRPVFRQVGNLPPHFGLVACLWTIGEPVAIMTRGRLNLEVHGGNHGPIVGAVAIVLRGHC